LIHNDTVWGFHIKITEENIDVKNVPGKMKNVKKRKKRGKNKKRLKTLNKKRWQ